MQWRKQKNITMIHTYVGQGCRFAACPTTFSNDIFRQLLQFILHHNANVQQQLIILVVEKVVLLSPMMKVSFSASACNLVAHHHLPNLEMSYDSSTYNKSSASFQGSSFLSLLTVVKVCSTTTFSKSKRWWWSLILTRIHVVGSRFTPNPCRAHRCSLKGHWRIENIPFYRHHLIIIFLSSSLVVLCFKKLSKASNFSV